MNRHLQDFDAALDCFGSRVTAVSPERWSSDSPCGGWTARDVVNHVVRNLRGLVVALDGGDFLSSADEPVGTDLPTEFAATRASAGAALLVVDEALDRTVRIGPREAPLEYLVDGLMRDIVIHTWDLARAVGGDERLPSHLVSAATEAMALVSEAMRRPGSYGPELAAPGGADAQTRLLAMSGRIA